MCECMRVRVYVCVHATSHVRVCSRTQTLTHAHRARTHTCTKVLYADAPRECGPQTRTRIPPPVPHTPVSGCRPLNQSTHQNNDVDNNKSIINNHQQSVCRPRGAQGPNLHSIGALACLRAPGPAQHSGLCVWVREFSTECGHLRVQPGRQAVRITHARDFVAGRPARSLALWRFLLPLSLCVCARLRAFRIRPAGEPDAWLCARTTVPHATLAVPEPKTLSLQP